MSFPTWSQSGVTSVVFSRADSWPRIQDVDPGQLIGISNSGIVRVATVRPLTRRFTLNFTQNTAMLRSDWLLAEAFLLDALVDRSAYPFTYVDTDNTSILVRYLDGFWSFSQISPTLMQGTITFRKEVLG